MTCAEFKEKDDDKIETIYHKSSEDKNEESCPKCGSDNYSIDFKEAVLFKDSKDRTTYPHFCIDCNYDYEAPLIQDK